jgi:hypothetical protein
MKKINSFICLLLLAGFSCLGQTKKIAHKSHSGSIETFRTAFEADLFDMSFSNFGAYPMDNKLKFSTMPTFTIKERAARLDSVIFLSENKAIMVTSKDCGITSIDSIYKGIWAPGRDTVINHPLFSKQHALDSIKTIITLQYHFSNPADSVKFIGFDNKKQAAKKKSKSKKESVFPVSSPENPKPPFSDKLPLYVCLLLLSSLFAGLFSWKYRQSC